MTTDPRRQVLRLRKKHQPGNHAAPTAADGARLVAAQSVFHGLLAGIAAIVLFAIAWSLITEIGNRFLPWLSLLLGVLVGLAIRRGGQGFDWRFPLLAAALTVLGSLLGLIVVSAGTTAAELETSTFTILRNVTTLTWPVFFSEVVTLADIIYAGFAAVIAAFLSQRRLNRREFQALRMWQDEQNTDDSS